MLENYDFKVNNHEKIKYNIFPSPNLELKNVQINLKSTKENLSVEQLKIHIGFLNIYNFKNFMPNKITLKDSSIKFQISNFKFFANQLFNKKKIYILIT